MGNLVLLDLLESQPKGVGEFRLAHFQHEPPHSETTADVLVDRIKSASRHFLPIR
jgi:hypothetical protein